MSERRAIRNVCVFCGSRTGTEPAFIEDAALLGTAIANRHQTVVYGGARVGLMGALADAALRAGGKVIGVIPKGLVTKEIAHEGLAEMHLTQTMHERKDRMIELADAFVALPGGFGTYDEFFEVLTLAQIGFHDKPIALYNARGFFDPLLALMKHTIALDFAAPEHLGLVVVEDEPQRLLDAMSSFVPPPLGQKALDRRGAP